MKFLQHDLFNSLITGKKIMIPCKLTFNEGGKYVSYFNGFINEVWMKFTNEELVFKCNVGTFQGKIQGNATIFTSEGSIETLTIHKPTTQDVGEGKEISIVKVNWKQK